MKTNILFLTGLTIALCGCHRGGDSIVGTWAVDKVNVQFDERRNTPELVRQIGEMEKQNTITISADSVLTLTNADGSMTGRLHLLDDGTILVDAMPIGQWKDRQIVTRTGSPIGEVVVTYRKR